MFGTVTGWSEKASIGIVTDSSGAAYRFDSNSFKDGCLPYVGMHVYFELTKLSQIQGRAENVLQILPRFFWKALA